MFVTVVGPCVHGRCEYLLANGRLSRPRFCRRPIELRARGTTHWRLDRRLRDLPPGRYVVRSDAVDGLHQHQRRPSTASFRID